MMNQLELEQESRKMALAIRTRNSEIGQDLITELRNHYSLEEIAAVMIVTVERLLFWCDADSILWSLQSLLPHDLMQEIHRITSMAAYKRLIGKGLIPGQDFSVDAEGKLLLNDRAQVLVLAP